MPKSLASRVKVRALRRGDDEVEGPGFVIEYEHDDGAELVIEVNPSRGPKGQIMITRLQPIIWDSDGNIGTSEVVLPQVSITWKHDEDTCGGYESEKPGVLHPAVHDDGRLDERVICLDLDDEPRLEGSDIDCED